MWFVMHATCLARVVERGEMVPHLGPVGASFHYTPLSNGDRLASLVESVVSWRPQRVEGGPAVPRENHGKKIGKTMGKVMAQQDAPYNIVGSSCLTRRWRHGGMAVLIRRLCRWWRVRALSASCEGRAFAQ